MVAGAGAIDHEQLVQLAGKAFGDLPNSSTTASDLVDQVRTLEPAGLFCVGIPSAAAQCDGVER